MIALHVGVTYERDGKERRPYAQRSLDFIDCISDRLFKKIGAEDKKALG